MSSFSWILTTNIGTRGSRDTVDHQREKTESVCGTKIGQCSGVLKGGKE